MTSYMCFIETLLITCTVSEILAQIDHKGPNWTFLALNKVHLCWFHSLHISSQYGHHPNDVAWCKINGQHFSNAEQFMIIWLKLRKMHNQTFPTLQRWPLERFNHIHLLTVHSYTPWEASCQLHEQFLNKWPIYVKMDENS